jgi:hypothetical protein
MMIKWIISSGVICFIDYFNHGKFTAYEFFTSVCFFAILLTLSNK